MCEVKEFGVCLNSIYRCKEHGDRTMTCDLKLIGSLIAHSTVVTFRSVFKNRNEV